MVPGPDTATVLSTGPWDEYWPRSAWQRVNRAIAVWTSLNMRRVSNGSQLGSHEGSSHWWHVALRNLGGFSGVVSTASGQLSSNLGTVQGELFQTRTVKTESVKDTWLLQPTVGMCAAHLASWHTSML